jgi:trimethylamine--corrinoid protein Co-methyltransferase
MKPQISFLSREEQDRIHEAALWILKEMGIQMPSQQAVSIMQKAGAKVDNKNIVKIPPELVKYALTTVPKREAFVLYGREEKFDVHFPKDTPLLAPMQEATRVIDLETGMYRPASNKDLADLTRLMEALKNVAYVGSLVTPQDVSKETSEWYALATMLKNTSKHIYTATPGAGFIRDAVKMASIVVGSEEAFKARPFISFNILMRAPLQISRPEVEALIEVSRQGLNLFLTSGAIAGATTPVTMVGAIAQNHAEVMSEIVLSQVVRPGTPAMYSCSLRSMDMTTANVAMSSPESAILRGAQAQMAQYLELPVRSKGFLRDAKVLDAQAGFETAMVGLVTTLSSDIIEGLQYEMDVLVDFADLVFVDEAFSALKRIEKGFSADSSTLTLALDALKEAGHGGSFIGSKHTLKNFRSELWRPQLFDRWPWGTWEKNGSKDARQRAREKAKEILSSYQPARLSPNVELAIDKIAKEAKIDLAKSI